MDWATLAVRVVGRLRQNGVAISGTFPFATVLIVLCYGVEADARHTEAHRFAGASLASIKKLRALAVQVQFMK
jgi:hypothetical protein